MFIRFEKKHYKYCQTDIVTHVGNELDASGRTLTRSESSKEKEKFKLSGESWNEGTLAESFTRSIQAGVLFIVSGKLTLSWSVCSDTSRRHLSDRTASTSSDEAQYKNMRLGKFLRGSP